MDRRCRTGERHTVAAGLDSHDTTGACRASCIKKKLVTEMAEMLSSILLTICNLRNILSEDIKK